MEELLNDYPYSRVIIKSYKENCDKKVKKTAIQKARRI
jgi:hypothetical protein